MELVSVNVGLVGDVWPGIVTGVVDRVWKAVIFAEVVGESSGVVEEVWRGVLVGDGSLVEEVWVGVLAVEVVDKDVCFVGDV